MHVWQHACGLGTIVMRARTYTKNYKIIRINCDPSINASSCTLRFSFIIPVDPWKINNIFLIIACAHVHRLCNKICFSCHHHRGHSRTVSSGIVWCSRFTFYDNTKSHVHTQIYALPPEFCGRVTVLSCVCRRDSLMCAYMYVILCRISERHLWLICRVAGNTAAVIVNNSQSARPAVSTYLLDSIYLLCGI